MKHITEFSDGIPADSPATELRGLPHRNWQEDIDGISSIIIVPATKRSGLHDSGYRCMDFAACHYGKAYCLLSGCSDVIHIGGIGGYNTDRWMEKDWPRDRAKRASWSIDCLPNSGLLQIFTDCGLSVGTALSSFEITSRDKRPALNPLLC